MRKSLTKLFAAICALGVTAGISSFPQANAAPDTAGQKRDVPVYRKSMDENETVECLFYADMPNVPYMSMEVYYKTFLDGEMTVTNEGGGRYTYKESLCGDTAQVNTETDVFTSDDLASFSSTPVYKMPDSKLVLCGPDIFVKFDSVQYDAPAKASTIDMGKYGIDIREQDGVVYYPFVTLSDIFGNVDFISTFYADGRIYFSAMYDDINGGDAMDSDPMYLTSLKTGVRPQDVIDMTYKELQLSLENFYGYPSDRIAFANEMKAYGMDAALTHMDMKTKELLLSNKTGDYLAGMDRLLSFMLCDGGHTGMMSNKKTLELIGSENVSKDYINGIMDIMSLQNEYTEKNMRITSEKNKLINLRESILGAGNYFSKGNTALICFDQFNVEYQGWKDYFSGKSSSMPDDSVSIVYDGLKKARAEGIKNVVIDLSANTGGDSVALYEIIGMITGKSFMTAENTLGGQKFFQKNIVDVNLDGRIDENDSYTGNESMRFAVMTTGTSFSCGNMMPSIMKDMGFMTMGEQSGGGTCAVIQRATADGVRYCMSSYVRFVDKSLKCIDDGVPVDVQLVTADASGNKDYSVLYDLDRLGREMENYYGSGTEQQSGTADNSTEESALITSRPAESIPEQSQPSQAQNDAQSSQDSSDSGWVGTIVWVFVIFGAAAAALIVTGIIFIRRR